MIKNTASQGVGAQMVSASDGSAFTGAVTVYVTGDIGTQAVGSVGAGACTHEGNGYHTYAPAQAETNYSLVAFTFTGTGAIPVTVSIYTITGDAFARLGAPAGASVSADILAIDNLVDDLESRLGTPSDLGSGATVAANLADIEGQTDDIGAAGAGLTAITNKLPAALVGGRIDASVGAVATNAITAAGIADGAIDRATFAVDTGLQTIRSGTLQDAEPGLVVLDASASATDDYYRDSIILITGGPGVGQVRKLYDYFGATVTGLVNPNWVTLPDNTSTFAILPATSVWDEFRGDHTVSTTFGEGVAVFNNLDKTDYAIGVGGIAATAFAAGAIDASALAANAIGSSELAQSAAQEIADEVLNRNIAGGASGDTRNVRSVLRRLRNKVAVAAGTATVYEEDDVTPSWTAAVTTTAGNPVTAVDPT